MKTITKYYWSRMPGKFVNKKTGEDIDVIINDKRFNSADCTVREWYETLIETVIDACNNIHRIDKIGANSIHVGFTAAAILESTVLFEPTLLTYKSESDVTKIGSIVNLDIYLDPSLTNIIQINYDSDDSRTKGEIEILDIDLV